jgi:hypothetical protein
MTGTLGWQQFLTAKHDMLSHYEQAKVRNRSHGVRVSHGTVAEASFREFLSQFLPKRFGVTSGYVISQGNDDTATTPHYDVVIYDQLESPILWVDENPDNSSPGQVRALPAEYVYAILEVKSALTRSSVTAAMQHLQQLQPLLMDIEHPTQPYRKCLPKEFSCAIVAFELRGEDQYDAQMLNFLVASPWIRGYFGGAILKGEGLHPDQTGLFWPIVGDAPLESSVGKAKESLLTGSPFSDSILDASGKHVGTFLTWAPAHFSGFVFSLLAIMKGTFRPGYLPTLHGMAWVKPSGQ